MKYVNVSAGVLLSVLFNAGAVEKAMDDSGAGLERTETVVVGRTDEYDGLNFAFLATNNIFTVGAGGAVVSRGSMTFGHALASAYNWYATNVFSIVDGGRIAFDNGGTSSSSAGFIFGSADVPRRRSRVLISGEGTVADFRHAYRSYFNGNTSVEIKDGATVYMGRYCGIGNATNIASSAAATASETKMTISGESTKIYLSNLAGTAKFYVGMGSGTHVTNRVTMTGGSIVPLEPNGTQAAQLAIANQYGTAKKIAHGVFEMSGGYIDLWVTNNSNPTVNCSLTIGPGNGEFLMSGGVVVCGDLAVGQNQPGNYSEGNKTHVQRLRMIGGDIFCKRLYLGSSNKLQAYRYQEAHVDLDGGVLHLERTSFNDSAASGGNAHGYFTADGGTIRARARNLNLLYGFDTAELGPDGLTVDNAGLPVTLSQSFSDKPGEKGRLVFTGSAETAYTPAGACTVSATVVKDGTLLFPGDTVLETKLVIDGGATVSLVGGAKKLTVDALEVTKGTIYLDPGDTIHLTSADVDLSGLTVRFSETSTSASVYDIFTFDGDVSGDAAVRNELRFLSVYNGVSGCHPLFTVAYDETSGSTRIAMSYRENVSSLSAETRWRGPGWNAEGWSSGVPDAMKAASFADSSAVGTVAVASGGEAGALSFTAQTDWVFEGDGLELSAPKGGSYLAMTHGSAVFNLPIGLFHSLPVTLAQGTAAIFNSPITGGGFVKTGKGALTLAADNRFRYAVSVGGGFNTVSSPGALDNLAGSFTLTEDTLAFINSADGSEMTISTPVTLSSETSSTNALILKTDIDVKFRHLTVEKGALVKRGAGKLTVEASESENIVLQSGYGPLSSSSNYRVTGSTLVEFAADGSAPAPEGRQYAGFNIAEGEMVIKGVSGMTKTVNVKTGCCIGMNVAGDAAVFAQPALTVDGADVDAYAHGHTTVGILQCGAEGCAVASPALRVLNGGRFHAGNIRLGNGAASAGAYPTLAVTNAQATAANAIRFEVTGGTDDRGAVVRTRDATLAVTGTGDGHHGIFVAGTVDADFDNTLVGGTAQIGKLLLVKESAGTLRFRNGSVFAAFPYNNEASASHSLTLVFDNAEWRWGGGDKTFSYVSNGVGDGVYKSNRYIKTEGIGMILKPDAGCTFRTEVPFIGAGGLVAAGEGTVAFAGNTLRFTGLLDIRSGTVDLSGASPLDALRVRGPGTLKGGDIGTLNVAGTLAGGSLSGAPVLAGVRADTVIVDFGADASAPVRVENLPVASYPADNPPSVRRWKATGTGHERAYVRFVLAGGEVRVTVKEDPGLVIKVR